MITAPQLEAGVHAVEKTLGVSMTAGGKHPDMGTHNSLLRLGDTTYLEVIAPDPDGPRPAHPRWFNLDGLSPDDAPQLAAWVVRTDDIEAASDHYTTILGNTSQMTRGDLEWQITIRSDGELPLDGAAPALIEWHVEPHPAQSLPDVGCSLPELRVFDPDPEQLLGMLTAIELESRPRVHWAEDEPAHIVAYVDTPSGRRTLGGPDSDLSV